MSIFTKKIGVIGGMGPEASVHFYKNIIKECQIKYRAVQDKDYPNIIIYNLPLEDFDETGKFNGNTSLDQLILAAQSLEKAGADFIVIVCNTVHFFVPQMQKTIAIPIINLIEEVSKKVKETGWRKIGLLTSQLTKELVLYQKYLDLLGVTVIETSSKQQSSINEIILKVMSGITGSNEIQEMVEIIKEMEKQNAQAVILGCTELPLAISQTDTEMVLFDSTKILVEVALERAR